MTMVKRYKILIVDDEIGLTAILQEELQEAGFVDVKIEKSRYHVAIRDMRVTATKP